MARLINVRLDDERLRKVRRLRERGVTLSDVVREAVDVQYAAVCTRPAGESVAAALDAIFARWPDPVTLPARDYDVHDRAASRDAIRRRLTRRA